MRASLKGRGFDLPQGEGSRLRAQGTRQKQQKKTYLLLMPYLLGWQHHTTLPLPPPRGGILDCSKDLNKKGILSYLDKMPMINVFL
jgi:hypothetical protein